MRFMKSIGGSSNKNDYFKFFKRIRIILREYNTENGSKLLEEHQEL